MTVSTQEPTNIEAGVTVKWQKSFSDFAYDDGYTTRYYTISGENGSATITGSYSAGVWTFELTPTANTLGKGTYVLAGYVEKGSGASLERYASYKGVLQVADTTVTAAETDTRTYIQRQLDLVNEAIDNYLNTDDGVPVEEMTINGKGWRRPSLADLYKIRRMLNSDLATEIRKQNARLGRRVGRSILVDLG